MRALLLVAIFAAVGASTTIRAAEQQSPITPPSAGESGSRQTLAAARERGARSAHADIKRGAFRILDFGGPLLPGATNRRDSQTGYPLVSIWGCIVTERFTTEVEAYNGTMRAWEAKHRR